MTVRRRVAGGPAGPPPPPGIAACPACRGTGWAVDPAYPVGPNQVCYAPAAPCPACAGAGWVAATTEESCV